MDEVWRLSQILPKGRCVGEAYEHWGSLEGGPGVSPGAGPLHIFASYFGPLPWLPVFTSVL